MIKFVEIPVNNQSTSRRRLICGVGVNDSDYITSPRAGGGSGTCPFYRRWRNIIERCYSAVHQEKYPTYKGCTVCDEWLIFSNFKSWMKAQDWEGKEIDKDIINPGNKIYSPDNCRFVTKKLNMLINDSAASRGDHPQGVSFDNKAGKFRANVSGKNTNQHIGYYDTSELARDAYVKVKAKLILQAASDQTDPLIANGLRLHANKLREQK